MQPSLDDLIRGLDNEQVGAGAGLGIQDHVVDDAQYSGVRKNHWQAVQRGQPTVGHGCLVGGVSIKLTQGDITYRGSC
mgnify:CR=1 FL=1